MEVAEVVARALLVTVVRPRVSPQGLAVQCVMSVVVAPVCGPQWAVAVRVRCLVLLRLTFAVALWLLPFFVLREFKFGQSLSIRFDDACRRPWG